jgi:O-antigen/teichoic acid export membrane protein
MGYLALLSLANPLLIAFFGIQWKPAVPVLMSLSLLGLLGNSLFVGNLLLRALGRADLELRYVTLPIVVNLCLLPFTTPHGLLAVVATLLFSALLSAPLLFNYLHKEVGLGFTEILKSGFRPWISGGGASLITWFFLGHNSLGVNLAPSIQLLLGGLIFLTAFLAMIFLIDRKFVFSLLSGHFL